MEKQEEARQKAPSNLPAVQLEKFLKLEFDFSDEQSGAGFFKTAIAVGKVFYRAKKAKQKITVEDLLKDSLTEMGVKLPEQSNSQTFKQLTDGTNQTNSPGTENKD